MQEAPTLVKLLDASFTFVPIPRPACGYPLDVQVRSIRPEGRALCPCCRIAIAVVDADASTYIASIPMNEAMADLQVAVNNLSTNLTLKL